MTGTQDSNGKSEQQENHVGTTTVVQQKKDVSSPTSPKQNKTDVNTKEGEKPFVHGRIAWISGSVVVVPPLLLLWAVFWVGVELQWKTGLVGFLFYLMNGLGITMGYHRLFSHRSFKASPALQWVMCIWGAGAFQGSVKWWCRNHRVHHRFVDTEKDPYNALKGFWFSHVGWMLTHQDVEAYGRVDVSDFNANPIVMAQHKYFWQIALTSGILAPGIICGLGWGDWSGGFTYAALAKMVYVHQTTFCINSLAHTELFSRQNYSHDHSSFDSVILAILILGEGYHNFHHEFAADYRNGIKWYHWDPTKWAIRLCEILGSATNLIRVPNEVIHKNYYSVKQQDAAKELSSAETTLTKLGNTVEKRNVAGGTMTMAEFTSRVEKKGEKLVIIGEHVVDLLKTIPTGAGYTHTSGELNWYKNHPGGQRLLDYYVGKDATEAMNGGIYKHTAGAFNLVEHLRVAKIVGGKKTE